MHAFLALKLCIYTLVAANLYQIYHIRIIGKQLRERFAENLYIKKKQLLWSLLASNILLIGGIEVLKRASPAPEAVYAPLLAFHLSIIGLLVLSSLTIVLRILSRTVERWHALLVNAFTILYIIASISGSILVYQMPTVPRHLSGLFIKMLQ